MDLTLDIKRWGDDNLAWVGSKHGTNDAQTCTLKVADFADHVTNEGFIPSGIPLKRNEDGTFSPVTDAADTLAGFLFTPQVNEGDTQIAPYVWHGLIRTKNLPDTAFDVTTLTAGNPAFTYKED